MVEGLQTQALQKWLPAILHDHLPGSHAAPQSQWHALREFARLIKARHRDSWWMDFLKDAGSPDFAAAVGGLQKSAEANAKGDFGGALNQAGSAEHLFSRMNNHAGFLRARREHSYALRRLLRGSECVRLDPTALYRETGDHYVWLKSYALLELASCYAMVGEAGTAEKLAQEGMQLAQSSGYGSLQLFAFAHTATYGRGETNAWTTYREGLKRYWMFPAEPARGVEFYVGLRGLAEYREWPYLAYGVAIENAAIAAQSEATASLVPALYRLATAASRVGEIPIAAGTIARAYGAFASLPAETSRALMVPLELAQADIESAAGNYSAAIARLERLQPRLSEMSNDWVAFEVHKALGDFYRASGRVDPAIAKYWQTLEIAWSRIKTLGQEEVRLRNEQELVETCRALSGLLSLEKDRSDQGLAIWRNCRRLYSRSASPEVGNTLQALLAADSTPPETTLTIVRLEKKIGVWVSGKGRAQFFVLKEDAAHVIQVGRRFAKLCGNPASSLSQLQQDGATLYHWFMAPLGVDGRRNGRVLVDADQPFAQIPWQAIPNPRGEYLGDSVDVVLLTAAGKPDAARSGGDFNSKSSILIVADPRGVRDEFGKLPPLNDTRVEAQEIAARFAKPSVLLGAAARAGDVVAAFPSRSIFHFAGHALADSRSSFLVLSDRPLATSEILRQKSFSTRLVVLAACSTSDTEVGLADDRSLIRAFLSRGAHQVIASAWRVDSDTTRSMMNTFYSELTNGRSVSTALRSAIRSTKARPATAHPYFWAAFNIYGRG